MRIAIVNGPNLNLLGSRETAVYGEQDWESFFQSLQSRYNGVDFRYFQSNLEGELINAIHDFSQNCAGIVLNAGGYTHSSIALGDAVLAVTVPVVEVHISNLHARESFRFNSYTAQGSAGVISGFGLEGYRLAIEFLKNQSEK